MSVFTLLPLLDLPEPIDKGFAAGTHSVLPITFLRTSINALMLLRPPQWVQGERAELSSTYRRIRAHYMSRLRHRIFSVTVEP
jgi:hypothetical protein